MGQSARTAPKGDGLMSGRGETSRRAEEAVIKVLRGEDFRVTTLNDIRLQPP